ncbi:hypothetical protein [Antarcticirhabdus aurantiaca]|uniref:Uncharacterized protein n=1 Tax=Antarcticirhabdus aurantiaca TaxID=2606717 RepID=A0ACD4NVE3_9HYPH|nr:hypothetical protein [Antarcticirhabdus aurantiaca]WAJ30740.1 hypothetical protein OXU80_11250 [Jeongeuplla avenae]
MRADKSARLDAVEVRWPGIPSRFAGDHHAGVRTNLAHSKARYRPIKAAG